MAYREAEEISSLWKELTDTTKGQVAISISAKDTVFGRKTYLKILVPKSST